MIVSHFQPPITGGEIYNYKLYKYLKSKFSGVDVISLYDTPYRFRGGFILRNLWFLKILTRNEKEIIIEDFVRSSDLFIFNLIVRVIRSFLKKKIKIISLVHLIYTPLVEHKLKRKLKFIMESIFVNESDLIIVNSEFTKREIEKLLKAKREILVAHPGLSVVLYKNKRKRIHKNQNIDLLFVGSVTSRKGVDTLVKSFKILIKDYKVKNLFLHIVGDLGKEPDFAKKIKDYCRYERIEDKVNFYGRVSKDKLGDLYATADIFVFPSLWEGFGIVLIEAMYNKLPIVATNSGAIPFLVKDGVNGFLVPPKNPKKLAEAIKKLIDCPELRKKFGENNYKCAQEFNWTKTFTRIEKALQKLLKNGDCAYQG